jgi:hypothetical protein
MSELANQFSTIFRDEHRAVRDTLFELSDAFRRRVPENSLYFTRIFSSRWKGW